MKGRLLRGSAAAIVLCVASEVFTRGVVDEVRVAGATATQAVLTYTTGPDGTPCIVEVSEHTDFHTLVHDVAPTLFPAANRDDRVGSLREGTRRTLVIGKRTADIAADGKRYSRALQANTQHYFRITCESGIPMTGSFRTTNIPLGSTYGDVLPVDPQNPGQYAWPTMRWESEHPSVIDPLTGVLFKPLSRPGTLTDTFKDVPFGSALSLDGQDEWSGIEVSARSGVQARYSGVTQNRLLLRTAKFLIYGGANWNVDSGFDYFQLQMRAWTAGALGEDAKLEVCLTVDGVSCASVTREVSASAQEPNQPAVIGTTTPYLDFWNDATHAVTRPDAARRSGVVGVDTTGRVAHRGGDGFSPNWTTGSRIAIGGSECLIARLQSAIDLTIEPSSCRPRLSLPIGSANYSSDNFGVLIRKKTSSRHPIFLANVTFNFGSSSALDWAYGGHTRFCADTLSPDASQPPEYGYHCDIRATLFWISPKTGETRLLGQPWVNGIIGGDQLASGQRCGSDSATFAPNNPNVFYCMASTVNDQGIVLKGEYVGMNEDIGVVPAGTGIVFPRTTRAAVNWTNLTPRASGKSLGALIRLFAPAFDASLFDCGIRGITADGKLTFSCLRGGQDTIGWIGVFDPDTRAVVAARRSWDREPARWCKIHAIEIPLGSDRWLGFVPQSNDLGATPGGGPWTTKIIRTDVADKLDEKRLEVCPPNKFGVTGAKCTAVVVEGEPCDVTPSASEPRNCPHNPAAAFLMEATPGDIFLVTSGRTEYVRLLEKDGTRWVIERGYGFTDPKDHDAGSSLYAMCTAKNWDIDGEHSTYWDYKADPHGTNATGKTLITDRTSFSHGFVTKEVVGGAGYWRDCPTGGCISVRKGSDISQWVSRPADFKPVVNASFAGQWGLGYENFVETYSAFPPTARPAGSSEWFLHTRPITSDSNLNTLILVSGHLYKVSLSQGTMLHRKQLPTMAMCGMHPLKDVSGPTSIIDDTDAGAFTYCVAMKNGECGDARRTRQTVAGDAYVNCPKVGVPLKSSCVGPIELLGVCFGDNASYNQAIVQAGIDWQGINGSESRSLGSGFRAYRIGEMYWNVRSLPDGSWALVHIPWFNLGRTEALLAKLPPYPSPDRVKRDNFVPVTVDAPAFSGASGAVAEFGYAENGGPASFYCTSRAEVCVKGGQAGNDYGFASDDIASTPCRSGCTITIPAIPQRVLYYRVRYLDATNATRGYSPVFVATVP